MFDGGDNEINTGGDVIVVVVVDVYDGFGVVRMFGVNDSIICLFFELFGVSNARYLSQNLCLRDTQIVYEHLATVCESSLQMRCITI